jgi:dTDP-4-amino-4,6-dideoxygalactose transaminase
VLLVSEPNLGVDEVLALAGVIESNWITMGDQVSRFEQAFAEVHGASDAIAVNSCTAGLHLALQALGIGPGDEVLVPSMSFVATASAVLYTGARPVFVDLESPDVPLLSCADAAAKCTPRTKAVILMHYAGYLIDGAAWRDLAQSRGLFLVEDSAHAVGRDRTALFSDVAVFSFYGNKNMTTGEGGMILAADGTVLERMRHARSHGLTTDTVQRLRGRPATYDVTMLGYNYRMNELCAAIGLVQLQKLDAWNSKREDLTACYRAIMPAACPEVTIPFSSGWRSAHHIMPALLPPGTDRDFVMAALRSDGVQTSYHYPPIHTLSLYRSMYPDLQLEQTENFGSRELTLPLHPKMEPADVERVVTSLARALSDGAGSIL